MVIINCYTAPDPVLNVTVPTNSISSSTLTLTWIKPSVLNSVTITYYTVFYLPVSNAYGPIVTSNRKKRLVGGSEEFAKKFTTTAGTLTNLNGSVTYRIQVLAVAVYNGMEFIGNRSAAVMATTAEGSIPIAKLYAAVDDLATGCITTSITIA